VTKPLAGIAEISTTLDTSMKHLKDIPEATIMEKSSSVTIVCNDGFSIKAIYKSKRTNWTFDWVFVEETDKFIPKRPAHLSLRKNVSDQLNAKKIADRPICN
jgi:hypothetical protein